MSFDSTFVALTPLFHIFNLLGGFPLSLRLRGAGKERSVVSFAALWLTFINFQRFEAGEEVTRRLLICGCGPPGFAKESVFFTAYSCNNPGNLHFLIDCCTHRPQLR